MPGYDLIRSDHPSNNKRGGVAISSSEINRYKLLKGRFRMLIFQLLLIFTHMWIFQLIRT